MSQDINHEDVLAALESEREALEKLIEMYRHWRGLKASSPAPNGR